MRHLVTALICAGVMSASARAQSDENLYVGSRPLAMGGAFTAVADDANAMFCNPAGLQVLRQHDLTSKNADLFGTGIRTTYLSYALPITRTQAVGIDWHHIGFVDGELGYNRDVIKAAFSRSLPLGVSVGASVKYMMTDMSLDRQSVGKGSGVGFDAGVLFSPIPKLKIGINVHDVSGTGVTYEGGGSSTLLPRIVRAGVAWQATERLMVAADLDRKFHLGAEYWFRDVIAFRTGVQKNTRTSDPLEMTFGLGLQYRAFQVDFSHAPGRRGLGQTQRYGFTLSYDPASSAVKIVDIETQDLFASYYKKYDGVPIWMIRLHNRSDRSLECRLTVSAPGYEEVPYQETLIVRKGDRPQAVPLRLSLSEDVVNVPKDVAIPIEVKVEYATATKTRSDKHSAKVILYGRGGRRRL